MTSQEAWHVARRVLGVYFVIQGLLYAAGAIAMIGIVLPEGSSRTGYLASALLQGAIAVTAGAILLRDTAIKTTARAVAEPLPLKQVALQLLGVFFAVHGASSFARAAARAWTIEAGVGWQASEFASAAVQIIAAVLLIVRPAMMARVLQRYDSD